MKRPYFQIAPKNTTFKPTNISGCTLWLDGTDPSFPSPPPSNGTAISNFADKSGNNANFIQNTALNQPVYVTNIVNSKAAIHFIAASNLNMTNGTSFMTTGAAFDFFFVVTPTVVGSNNFFYNDGQTHAPVLGFSSTNFTFIGQTTWANGLYAQAFAALSTYVIEFQYNGSGATASGNFTTIVNGTTLTRGGSDAGAGGGTTSIGSDVIDATIGLTGYISAIVFYNNIISSANRTSLMTYLNSI